MSKYHEWIFKEGVRRRNPSLWAKYDSLKESESFSIHQLRQLQEIKLNRLLNHAFSTVPFYQTFSSSRNWKHGVKSDGFNFKELPIITKDDLISLNREFHSTSKFSHLFFCETSGTSGKVLTFQRNEEWDSFNRASIFRGYSWYDISPWEYNIYFWGYGTKFLPRIKLRLLDFLVNRYRIFEFDSLAASRLEKKISKASYIEGYSSMIYELARNLENEKLDIGQLKMIKGTSEKVMPHYQEKVKKVFGKKIINEYGAAESGIISFECPSGSMHINMEGVMLEVEENGEVLVTNLESYSFPIIRYRLGDSIKLSDKKDCPCGMKHPVIEEIYGRVGKVIYGKKERYPSLKLYYVFKGLYFEYNIKLNYQGYQEKKGHLTIRLDKELTETEKLYLGIKLQEVFGEDLEIQLTFSEDFREEQGKLRDFISRIPD